MIPTNPESAHFCGDETALLKSRRIVRELLRFYSALLPRIAEIQIKVGGDVGKLTTRLIHNVVTQNAHSIQELYTVIPQESLTSSYDQQVELVSKLIQSDPIQAAKAFLMLLKNNYATKCEFSAFNKLHISSEPTLKTRPHVIHKVVMNAVKLFSGDFREKELRVELDNCFNSVNIDYESIQVVLHHLFDNAAKYVLPNTTMKVMFPVVEERQSVCLDMVSMEISDTDTQRMFDEGYSGELPRALGLAGQGLGLGIIRQLLELNNAHLIVRRNVDPQRAVLANLGTYENNQFEVVLGSPI